MRSRHSWQLLRYLRADYMLIGCMTLFIGLFANMAVADDEEFREEKFKQYARQQVMTDPEFYLRGIQTEKKHF